jgi:hypothetical protein
MLGRQERGQDGVKGCWGRCGAEGEGLEGLCCRAGWGASGQVNGQDVGHRASRDMGNRCAPDLCSVDPDYGFGSGDWHGGPTDQGAAAAKPEVGVDDTGSEG